MTFDMKLISKFFLYGILRSRGEQNEKTYIHVKNVL